MCSVYYLLTTNYCTTNCQLKENARNNVNFINPDKFQGLNPNKEIYIDKLITYLTYYLFKHT